MIEVDYIVVGLGIAGICMCEEIQRHNKTFLAVDSGNKGSTARSGGVFNPTVLKRFNAAWNTSEFYPVAIKFYNELSEKLAGDIFEKMSIWKVFKSVEEQNNWSVASDKRELHQFLSSQFLTNNNPAINGPLGFGEVMGTARINTITLLKTYQELLDKNRNLLLTEFQYDEFEIKPEGIVYKNYSAEKIIFCEGAKATENPFFPDSAIIPNKGEYLVIKADQLNLEVFLKGSLYIIPLGDSLYKVGATFNSGEWNTDPSNQAREEITSKLRTMINCPFEIVDQTAGIRPTTRDRKPLLGCFPQNPSVNFFNGLGSRGFTMAPLLSQILYQNLSMGIAIPQEMDINRIKR